MEHHYSLKWNNHPQNISSVFSRLREEQLFTDVTLATGDRQTILAHRVVLSAGSVYLERILSINPSDHPTLVLSNIRYRELKLLVDFMYSGEISVDQPVLPGLLEAASWLQIKGLYEARTEQEDGTVPEMSSPEPELTVTPPQQTGETAAEPQQRPQQLMQQDQLPSPPQQPVKQNEQIPKKRKRSFVEKVVDYQVESDPNVVGVISPKKFNELSDQVGQPVVGISNTGWLVSGINDTEKKDSLASDPINLTAQEDKDDIPKLLSLSSDQQQLLKQLKSEACNSVQESLLQQAALYSSPQHAQMMQAMQSSYLTQLAVLQQHSNAAAAAQLHGGSFTTLATNNANLSQQPYPKFTGLMNSAPVRRYKQYTETSLQAALKEIEEGQSINRSSMKHNIPARTLRDWMKRMNIKSVYTHNKDSKEGSVGSTSPEPDLNISIEKLRTVFQSVQDESEDSQQLKIDDNCSKMSSVPMVA